MGVAMAGCCLKVTGVLVLVVALFLGALKLRLQSKEFVFDAEELANITKGALFRTKGIIIIV